MLASLFSGTPVVILIDQRIKKILSNPEVSSRLAKSAIKLDKHDISFFACSVCKGKILADFLVELPGDVEKKTYQIITDSCDKETWHLYTDGAVTSTDLGRSYPNKPDGCIVHRCPAFRLFGL